MRYTAILFVLVMWGCSPVQRPLDNLPCSSEGECVEGWVCDTKTDLCVREDGPCSPDPCSHGVCNPVDGSCACDEEWSGNACDVPDDPCTGINCGDYGTCSDGTCVCIDGYTGDLCEIPPDLCADVTCDPGYECRPSDGECVPEGKLCEPDPCDYGTCNSDDGSCTCDCDSEYCWVGTICDTCASDFIGDDCHRDWCADNTCAHGNCVDEACQCPDGYTGTLCDECASGYYPDGDDCVEDTNCQLNTCSGHGTCDDASGVPVCTCDLEYSGDYCDTCADGFHWNSNGTACTSDPCDPNPCIDPNKTQCTDDDGNAVCSCDTGYQDNDSDESCLPDCSSLDCGDHGICDDSVGPAICECGLDWSGELCDIYYIEAQVLYDNEFPYVSMTGGLVTVIYFQVAVTREVSVTQFNFTFAFENAGQPIDTISITEIRFYRGKDEHLTAPEIATYWDSTYLDVNFNPEVLSVGIHDYRLEIRTNIPNPGDNVKTALENIHLMDGTDIPIDEVEVILPNS